MTIDISAPFVGNNTIIHSDKFHMHLSITNSMQPYRWVLSESPGLTRKHFSAKIRLSSLIGHPHQPARFLFKTVPVLLFSLFDTY